MAVRQLREHRFCGDCYPENGWPEVNEALAQYALERRMGKPNKPVEPQANRALENRRAEIGGKDVKEA